MAGSPVTRDPAWDAPLYKILPGLYRRFTDAFDGPYRNAAQMRKEASDPANAAYGPPQVLQPGATGPSPQMLMEDDLPAVPRVPDSESIGDVPQPVGVSNPPAQSDKGSSRAQVGGDVVPSGERIAATSIGDPVVAATNAALAVDTEKDMASAYEKAADAARARMAAILGNVKNAGISDRDKWLSLALGGARMAASRNPTFFGAAGEGAEAGIGHFMQADERARRAALQQAQQEIGAETAAESAGARAENRVIRREDIKARGQERLDQLQARRDELRARLEDRALDREARAASEREYRNIQLEIAKIRDVTNQRGQDLRLQGQEIRAAARKEWAPEPLQKALATWEQNKDDPELGALAWNRVQKVAGLKTPQDIEMFAQRMAADELRAQPVPPKDPAAFKAEVAARYRGMMGGAAPTAKPAPAAAAPSAGPVTVKTPAEAAALPPGTAYQTPDGRKFVR